MSELDIVLQQQTQNVSMTEMLQEAEEIGKQLKSGIITRESNEETKGEIQ